jgi:hypothetical protein
MIAHEYCGRPDCKPCWPQYKARSQSRTQLLRDRATPVPPSPNYNRGARLHACPHTRKHHKAASGRCRSGCGCRYAMDRAVRKAQVPA